jgi:hypothetical protein
VIGNILRIQGENWESIEICVHLPLLSVLLHFRKLRTQTVDLSFMKAIFSEPEIVTRRGKPVSVILSIKDYEELLERAEDAEDVLWLKKARRRPMHYRPLEEYVAERKQKSVHRVLLERGAEKD